MAVGLHRRRRAAAIAALVFLTAAPATGRGLIVFGSAREGGSDNAFERIMDLDSGHERTTEIHGPSSSQQGFDGQMWEFVNAATATVDLPSELADRRAELWVRQSAWRILGRPHEAHRDVRPAGASAIRLTFDAVSRRVASALIDGDYGPVTLSFGDWRPVGSYIYPFRLERTGDADENRVELAQSVRLVDRVETSLLARPLAPKVAHLAGPAVTIPFAAAGSAGNHIPVMATINGTPARFIFDSGGANILTTDAAKRLSIAASGGISIGGVGEGSESGGFGLVDRVALGGASLDDQSFVVMPSFFPPENGRPTETAGLLGYEFLAHFVTTIDYRAQTMTFRDSVPVGQRGVRLPFFSDGHGIAINAQVNGKAALLGLGTGDGGTVTFFPAYTAAAHLDGGAAETKVSGGGAGGSVKEASGTVARFTLGGVEFPNLSVRFSRNRHGAFASRGRAGNLGAAVLRCFRITFDYRHHQLWLEPQLDTPRCAATAATPA